MQRWNDWIELTQEVSKLGEVIRAEFARDRDIRFKAALEAARDAFESNHSSQREATWSARKDLFEAREHFLTDFHELRPMKRVWLKPITI